MEMINYLLSYINKPTEAEVQCTPPCSTLGTCCGYLWMQKPFPCLFLVICAGVMKCARSLYQLLAFWYENVDFRN